MSKHPETEFSRPFSVADLHEAAERRIEASEAERHILARRFDVDSVDGLAADLRLIREMGAIIRLEGRITADVTQTCVVTLESLKSHFEIVVHRRYAPPEAIAEEEEREEEIPFEEEDPPDVFRDGVIDLGDAVAELLSLEIDPFPRSEGAEFSGFASGPEDGDRKESPFAILEGLVKKPK